VRELKAKFVVQSSNINEKNKRRKEEKKRNATT